MDIISLQTKSLDELDQMIEIINNISPVKLNLSIQKRDNCYCIINDIIIGDDEYTFIIFKLRLTQKNFMDNKNRIFN